MHLLYVQARADLSLPSKSPRPILLLIDTWHPKCISSETKVRGEAFVRLILSPQKPCPISPDMARISLISSSVGPPSDTNSNDRHEGIDGETQQATTRDRSIQDNVEVPRAG